MYLGLYSRYYFSAFVVLNFKVRHILNDRSFSYTNEHIVVYETEETMNHVYDCFHSKNGFYLYTYIAGITNPMQG